MRSGSTLIRECDGKEFTVVTLGHWSEISSVDGETDTVKFYGPGYVSASKGFTYTVKETP